MKLFFYPELFYIILQIFEFKEQKLKQITTPYTQT